MRERRESKARGRRRVNPNFHFAGNLKDCGTASEESCFLESRHDITALMLLPHWSSVSRLLGRPICHASLKTIAGAKAHAVGAVNSRSVDY
jgi:hypothetical protein